MISFLWEMSVAHFRGALWRMRAFRPTPCKRPRPTLSTVSPSIVQSQSQDKSQMRHAKGPSDRITRAPQLPAPTEWYGKGLATLGPVCAACAVCAVCDCTSCTQGQYGVVSMRISGRRLVTPASTTPDDHHGLLPRRATASCDSPFLASAPCSPKVY